MKKFGTRVALVALAVTMAGCASSYRDTSELESDIISRELDARVIDCTLPYLNTHAMTKAAVRYRYDRGSTTFESNDPTLSAHLAQCASTSKGPDVTFDREIDVWTSTED